MKGFRSFLLRGNVVDLAVGIVVGAAFTAVVNGFVTAFLSPIVGVITKSSGDYSKKHFTVHGMDFPYGTLVSAVISFVLVAAVVYFCVVLPVNKLHDRFMPKTEAEPGEPTKQCPECLSDIPQAATRCAFCTVQQPAMPVAFPKQ